MLDCWLVCSNALNHAVLTCRCFILCRLKFPQILILPNACILTFVCKLTSVTEFIQCYQVCLFVHTAFLIMLSIGSWHPICSQKFLTGHLSIVGALNEPSTFCLIQGQNAVAPDHFMYDIFI